MSGFGSAAFGAGSYGAGGSSAEAFSLLSGTASFSELAAVFVDAGAVLQASHASSVRDALNPVSWSVSANGASIPVLAVDWSSSSGTLYLWRRLSEEEDVTVSLSGKLASGGPVLGIWSVRALRPSRTRNALERRDVANAQFVPSAQACGLTVSGGDYAYESGASLRKKSLIRRLTSAAGSFKHARQYGSLPNVKIPYSERDLLQLQDSLEKACLLEDDASAVDVRVSLSGGVLVASIRMTYSSGEVVPARISWSPDGSYSGV